MRQPTEKKIASPGLGLCTEAEIEGLVHGFYAQVRRDAVLGPVFEAHIDDWDPHLAKLVDFWSSILRRTGRFSGAPMPRHVALPGLSAPLFQQWLKLFRENAAAQPNQAMAQQACAMAERIAQSLWMGYQISRDPDAVPATLSMAELPTDPERSPSVRPAADAAAVHRSSGDEIGIGEDPRGQPRTPH